MPEDTTRANARGSRRDDPEAIAAMHRWLEQASRALGVPASTVTDHEGALLALTSAVAHGPSRPAAPLTAFLAGYAAASQGRDADDVARQLTELARAWEQ